jgi:ubiquinone/menaquinone biosynthesis C-methylase UbiE
MQDKKRIEKEKKFWSKLAPKYDRFIEKNWKIYPSLLDKISEDVGSGNIILEVATGTGLVALKVAGQSSKVYGIDISSPMIEEAKRKMEEKEIKNIELSVEDAYALPFDNDMFDTIICNNVLHNMKYPENALSEIKRALKPGGKLIAVIVGIGESPKYKIAMTIYNLFIKLPVFHKLNLDESANMICEAGFTVVKKERIKDPEDKMPMLYIVAEPNLNWNKEPYFYT